MRDGESEPISVRFETPAEFLREYAQSISRGGVFVPTTAPAPVGAKVVLSLDLPGATPIPIVGEVVFVATDAATRPGMGVRFQRLDPESERQLSALARAAAEAVGGARILVVDDDAFVLARVGDALRAEGYSVVAAPSAARALDLVKQQRFDLVISDIEMPRLDGLEFCDNLRSNPGTASIPFMFLTALDTEENRRVAAELGVRHVLGKPVDPARFLAAVREAIASGRPSASPPHPASFRSAITGTAPATGESSGPALPMSAPTPAPLPNRRASEASEERGARREAERRPSANRTEPSAGVAPPPPDSGGTVLLCVTCGGTYVLGDEVDDERLLVECPPCLAHGSAR